MGKPAAIDKISLAMYVKNHAIGQSSYRVHWNQLKAQAHKAGVDTRMFDKKLGPELDKFVAMLSAADAQLARSGGQLPAEDKQTLKKQYEKVERIVDSYTDTISAAKAKPDATARQVDALVSLKQKLQEIDSNYGRRTRELTR